MKFKLEVDLDSAAFEDEAELPQIVRRATGQFVKLFPGLKVTLRDSNGNTVGRWEITE